LGSSTSPFVTIQQGLSAIINGGSIIVADGVYKGVGNKRLNLSSSATSISSVNGPESTIIDCEGDGYGIDLFSGTFSLTGFTIRNCQRNFQNPNRSFPEEGSYGGAAISIHSTYTVLTNVTLENNSATGFGGAIYIWSNSVEIYNSTITNNVVNGLGGGIYTQSANIKVGSGTRIQGNTALWTNVTGNGTDLFCFNGAVELLDQASVVSGFTCASCSITRNNTNLCVRPSSSVGVKESWNVILLLFVVVALISTLI